MKQKTKKFFLSLIAFINIFVLSAQPAQAFEWVDFSATDKMNEMLTNLRVDKAELMYQIQTMNVSRQKKQPPQVSLTFNPTDPAPGQKVIVTATPTYFMNESRYLYFTWYLKTAGCTDKKTDGNRYNYEEKCDLDEDNDVDIEDYKIKAMRLIANRGFDWDIDENGKPDDNIYEKNIDSDEYKAVYGGDDQKGKKEYCFIHDTESGDEFEIECAHLFPDTPGEDVGDGEFGLSEEKFWRTNPADDDTADTGNVDEANVTGLGITNFAWNYTPGDKIGVVVEGISVEPTQEPDASYRTMWAWPKNDIDIDVVDENDYPNTTTTEISRVQLTDPATGLSTGITQVTEDTTTKTIASRVANRIEVRTVTLRTIKNINNTTGEITTISQTTTDSNALDPNTGANTNEWLTLGKSDLDLDLNGKDIKDAREINEVLYQGLIAPSEGGGVKEKFQVELSYYPEVPMNDSSGESGESLSIKANVLNAQNTDYLTYEWQLYENDQPNPDSWGSPILKSRLKDEKVYEETLQGLGLDTLKLDLRFKKPKKYLRAKVTVTENVSRGTKREGRNDVVIPIQSISERIRVFNTDVSSDLELSLGNIEKCQNGMDTVICPISKNEIIGLKINNQDDKGKAIFSDFQWTVNGELLKPSVYGGEETTSKSNTVFFPALKNPGATYDITLTATNQETGEKLNLTKTFEVVDPEINIIPLDEKTCKPILLGHYVDLDNNLWPDYSENEFLALTGYPIKLSVSGAVSSSGYSWAVDGESKSFTDTTETLTIPPKEDTQTYRVTVSTLYTQNNNTKKALNKYWKVPLAGFYEKTLGDTVDITMVKFMPLSMAQNKNTRILASVWSAAPEYLMFLFRIVLTAFIMIAAARIVFMISPHYELRK